ncbi:Hypothetical protein NTJ_13013 [Nesidiocoris tenuis]|uniref:Platelet-derived growth factor (PDGF) family profile domain-containing protein n=1 Tax=Nesidiocoris tenuis TaxID=355587 RepID=A0ABN7B722_9HEMI|nr:Hypothetical protein NTJ_13013 [Nesidiocoris tenuis]
MAIFTLNCIVLIALAAGTRLDDSQIAVRTTEPAPETTQLPDFADDYEDEPDDAQYYDDETDDDEPQADYRPPFRYASLSSDYAPSRKVEKFWNSFRPSHTSLRFLEESPGDDDVKMQEEVKRHHSKIAADGKCRQPQPRVVRAADYHPSASKTYLPSCTILHQCSESTGCCPMSQRCGPKRTEKLELAFYAIYDVNTGGHTNHLRPRKALRVERLIFYNHTECECQIRGDEMPRDVLPTLDPPPAEPKCRCPSQFAVRQLPTGQCACDCFDRQKDCIKYKRGKDYLNHEDRLCIEMRKCHVPTCDYGNYVRRSGRCPRKDEKYRF